MLVKSFMGTTAMTSRQTVSVPQCGREGTGVTWQEPKATGMARTGAPTHQKSTEGDASVGKPCRKDILGIGSAKKMSPRSCALGKELVAFSFAGLLKVGDTITLQVQSLDGRGGWVGEAPLGTGIILPFLLRLCKQIGPHLSDFLFSVHSHRNLGLYPGA